jgi:hypothetical protein
MREAFMALILATLGVLPARAQVAEREGAWVGAGLGPGWAGATCDACTGAGRQSSWSGYLRGGATVAPRTKLAVELDGWVHTPEGADQVEGGANERILLLGAAVLGYPIRQQGLFLKLGLGVSQYRSRVGSSVLKTTGVAPSVGMGYDAGLGRDLYITPFVQYFRSIVGDEVTVDGHGTDFAFHPNLIQAGVGLTWRKSAR